MTTTTVPAESLSPVSAELADLIEQSYETEARLDRIIADCDRQIAFLERMNPYQRAGLLEFADLENGWGL